MKSINPATGELVREYPLHTPGQVEDILVEAVNAQRGWRQAKVAERTAPLLRAAELLEERRDELAELAALEMGKPLPQGRAEADKCAWVCRYYAERAESMLADEPVDTDAYRSLVSYDPLGLVLAVMPWNFPYWQVFRFAAPALAAGNAALLKHAPNVPGCAEAIEEIFRAAGLEGPLFRNLLVSEGAVADLLADSRIAAATLTGSVRAGRSVASSAGANLKPTVLELGGSDPYIVLEDADIERAAETCVESRLINSGQSCIAAKRFIAVGEVAGAFTEAVVEKMRAATMGAPLEDEAVKIGPQARRDLRDELHRQVQVSHEQGARILLGGSIPEGPGAFYPPTVLSGVEPGTPAGDEELFGPAAAIMTARNEAHAVELANDSEFGLGAAVFTSDLERGERLARSLDAGSAFVNAFVKSDPRLPFGGIKTSGYGRELSTQGIREFTNTKTIYIAD